MKATFVNIEIDRDPMTKIPKVVAAWEVPLYESKFGEGGVVIGEEVEVEVDEVPDVRDELSRLANLHGVDEATKQSHVELAYGRGSQAVKALNAAILEAFGKAPAKGGRKAKADEDDGEGADAK